MFTPPTIAEIRAQFIADVEAETGQTTPLLSRAFTRVLAKAIAGVVGLLYRRILWAYLQIFPETAEEESIAYHEDRYGIVPSPAVAAILSITIAGADGATIPAGTYWTSPDNGLVYSQALAAVISGGTATAQVECLDPGADSTLSALAVLALVSPIAGVTGTAVASVTLEGQDADTLEERRAQVIQRMQRTDEIGTAGYYISKALEVSGIAFARVARNAGGDVNVYPLTDVTGLARVPDAGLLATVQSYLQDTTRRPLCANVYALAATERTANVTISGASPSDATTKANIEAAISAYLFAAYPRQFTDEADPTDQVSVGGLWAIIVANGAVATGLSLEIVGIGSGVTSYQLPVGEIIKLGSVTWA